MTKTFAENLKAARLRNGLSLRDLAEFSGLSYEAIRKLENGKNNPTVKTAQCLAEALGVVMTDLTGGE